MTTSTMTELFSVAIRDLWEGRDLIRNRMQSVADAVSDRPTRESFIQLIESSCDDQRRLALMVDDPHGDPNLWVDGILRDAARDVDSNARGSVRDVALIGAVRKLIAADIVSLETAIHLAEAADGVALRGLRSAACESDGTLRQRLAELTQQV